MSSKNGISVIDIFVSLIPDIIKQPNKIVAVRKYDNYDRFLKDVYGVLVKDLLCA